MVPANNPSNSYRLCLLLAVSLPSTFRAKNASLILIEDCIWKMGLYKCFPGIGQSKIKWLFIMNYVGLLTLLSGWKDECGKHWRMIHLIKVEDSEILVNLLMYFSFRQMKKEAEAGVKNRMKYALNIHSGQKWNLSILVEENWRFHRILLTIWW